jgi:ABC-type dipeptide/oligopeptide/nickel transport system permease subunit
MSVAIVVQIVVITIGVPVGAIAGWFGGRADNSADALVGRHLRLPGPSVHHPAVGGLQATRHSARRMDGLLLVFVAIGLTTWVTVARLVRGQMLALKETEFVEAAKAIGVPDRKIVTGICFRTAWADHRRDHPRHPGGHPRGSDARLYRHRRPGTARLLGEPGR